MSKKMSPSKKRKMVKKANREKKHREMSDEQYGGRKSKYSSKPDPANNPNSPFFEGRR